MNLGVSREGWLSVNVFWTPIFKVRFNFITKRVRAKNQIWLKSFDFNRRKYVIFSVTWLSHDYFQTICNNLGSEISNADFIAPAAENSIDQFSFYYFKIT